MINIRCAPSTKMKSGVLKFYRFEERFRKAPFFISVEGRPHRTEVKLRHRVDASVLCLPHNLRLNLEVVKNFKPAKDRPSVFHS